jgi:hypothetical protein
MKIEVMEKSADTFRKYQEQINKTTQEILNNAIELQKNVFEMYQLSYTQFFDRAFEKYDRSLEFRQMYYNDFVSWWNRVHSWTLFGIVRILENNESK